MATELEKKREQVAQMQLENKAREERLNGRGAGITELGVLQLRLRATLDLLFAGDAEAETEWEIHYHARLAETFDRMEKDVAKPRIHVPGT